jgi:hypothetical protein
VTEAQEQQLALIETVTRQLYESGDVVGGSPTDILYLWAWSLFLNELSFIPLKT